MRPRSAAIWTSSAAFGFSLFQLFHRSIGQDEISRAAAPPVVVIGLVYVWWVYCLQEASRGEASPLSALLVLAAGWSLAGNGVGALAACLPECDRAELFIGVGNSVLGAAAVGANGWAIRREPSPVRPRAGLISAVLVAAALTAKAGT